MKIEEHDKEHENSRMMNTVTADDAQNEGRVSLTATKKKKYTNRGTELHPIPTAQSVWACGVSEVGNIKKSRMKINGKRRRKEKRN